MMPFSGTLRKIRPRSGYALALAALWYLGGLLRRLRNGTAGVKPVRELVGKPWMNSPDP